MPLYTFLKTGRVIEIGGTQKFGSESSKISHKTAGGGQPLEFVLSSH